VCFIEIGIDSLYPQNIISTAKSLGYTKIGLNKKTFSNKLDIINRLDLNPKNSNELQKKLRKNRWKTEIITVNCRNKSLARLAGQDRRVDLITYPLLSNWKSNHLDIKQANLMRDSGCGYLVNISHLLETDKQILVKTIKFLKRNTDNAIKKGIVIVASTCTNNIWGLRDPHGLAALLSLLEIDEKYSLEMISSIPLSLVEHNRGKLNTSLNVSGVGITEDG
jgi:RNase P/RNase MRP subunit p30